MSIFKKKDHDKNIVLNDTHSDSAVPLKVKKKVRIGFGRKSKKERTPVSSIKTPVSQQPDYISSDQNDIPLQEKTLQHQQNIDVFLDELMTKDNQITEDILRSETTPEVDGAAAKRKAFAQRDMRGKQVYLEDTGEKIGTVFDTVIDPEKNLIGYKIKDNKSGTILSFSLDQFDEDKNGLIFIPSWYAKGLKTIEKLEFKDRITPELIWLIKDNTVSTEELYNIFVKHDDTIVHYIEEAIALRELVNKRLQILEKERLSLKEHLMDLTEKRLIKDIDRRQFSEIVMEHRRKVNIVDINLKKSKELLQRLEQTSFGLLSTNIAATVEKEEHQRKEPQKKDPAPSEYQKDDRYQQKFYELKDRYEKLQEGYNELKGAVEKLLIKNENE